jgi:hypothetical protein
MSADYQVIYNPNFSTPKLEMMHGDPPGLRGRDEPSAERPLVVMHGERRVLFGPGVDDFNEFDDPC